MAERAIRCSREIAPARAATWIFVCTEPQRWSYEQLALRLATRSLDRSAMPLWGELSRASLRMMVGRARREHPKNSKRQRGISMRDFAPLRAPAQRSSFD